MQKKLIALAVAGLASSAAFAQTNVTIYGVADATFESASATGSAYNTAKATDLNRGAHTRVNTNSSLIGFKGTEALGNGLNALFQFESGASFDSAGALSLGRDSFVGLSSDKFGTVKLGNLTTPTRLLGASVDMNAGATGPGANASLIGKVIGGNAMIAGTTYTTAATTLATEARFNNGATGYNSGYFDTRWTNTIMYTSPTWSGVSLAAAYRAGEDKNLDSKDNTASQVNTSAYDLGVTYANGPIYAGLTYGKVTERRDGATYDGCSALPGAFSASTGVTAASTTSACKGDESSIWRLAGAYTFTGGHKIAALYEQNRVDYNSDANVSHNVKQNTWGIGGKFMATPMLAVIGQYYKSNDARISNNAPDGNTGANLWQLGVEYSLSKRTMLKASYSRLNNDADVNNDFLVGSVGGGFGSGANPTVWAAGIRHTF